MRFKIEKRNLILIFSVICSLAVVTCFICDYFITQGFSWSLIVVLAVISIWLFIPFVVGKKNTIRKALIVLSIICLPFFLGLSMILNVWSIFTLGGRIAFISCLGLWGIYFIFRSLHGRLLLAFGFSFLLTIPLVIAIVWITDHSGGLNVLEQKSVTYQVILSSLLAISCFAMSYVRKMKF